jgi:hypothetical protein
MAGATVAVIMMLGAAPLTFAPAAMAFSLPLTLSQVSLGTGPGPITSSTHTKLQIELDAGMYGGPAAEPGCEAYASVALSTKQRGESHNWNLPIPCTELTETNKGTGTLKVASSSMGPLGQISLTFTPLAKPTTLKCNGGEQLTYREAVSGTLVFHTGSAGPNRWGTVDSIHKTLSAGKYTLLQLTYGSLSNCPTPKSSTMPCLRTFLFTASTPQGSPGTSRQVDTSRSPDNDAREVGAGRTVYLTSPAGAFRTDFAEVKVPAVKFTVAASDNRRIVVTTDRHGASGGATATTSGSAQVSRYACTIGGKSEQGVIRQWTSGSYTNAAKPLRFTDIYGAITVANYTGSLSLIANNYQAK